MTKKTQPETENKAPPVVRGERDRDPKCWDLSRMCASEDAWLAEFKALEALIPSLASFAGTLGKKSANLLAALTARDEVLERLQHLGRYAEQRHHQNLADSFYGGRYGMFMQLAKENFEQTIAYLKPEIVKIPEAKLGKWLKSELFDVYRFELTTLLRNRDTVLSLAEEQLWTKTTVLHGVGANLHDAMSASLKFPAITNAVGETIKVSDETFTWLLQHPERPVRKQVFESLFGTYGQFSPVYAAIYYATVAEDRLKASARKFVSSLHASVNDDNLTVDLYANLVAAVRAGIPTLNRYHKMKFKRLGIADPQFWDMYVSALDSSDPQFTYEWACEQILQSMEWLPAEYVDVARYLLSHQCIDIYPAEGKMGGAYSNGSYRSDPYMLMNWVPTLRSVFTLCHELWHSIHSWYSRHNQPFTTARYTILVAENASMLGERNLLQHLLKTAETPERKLYYLNYAIEDFRNTLFRQTMFFEFEWRAHQLAESGKPLTIESLDALYEEIWKDYYGAVIAWHPLIAKEWQRIPHFFHAPFYVPKYSTGKSGSSAIFELFLSEEGPAAVERWIAMVKEGGSRDPLEQLRFVGVDMATPEPVQAAVRTMEGLIDQFEKLSALSAI
jgi:oligoendopeptidase F